jgi:hypothetical protein
VILCKKGNANEALQQLRKIMSKLKLTVNEEKTNPQLNRMARVQPIRKTHSLPLGAYPKGFSITPKLYRNHLIFV